MDHHLINAKWKQVLRKSINGFMKKTGTKCKPGKEGPEKKRLGCFVYYLLGHDHKDYVERIVYLPEWKQCIRVRTYTDFQERIPSSEVPNPDRGHEKKHARNGEGQSTAVLS